MCNHIPPRFREIGRAVRVLLMCAPISLIGSVGAEEIFRESFDAAPANDLCDNMWGDKPAKILANGAQEGIGRDGSKGAHLKLTYPSGLERNLSYWRCRIADPIPIVEELGDISFWVKGNVPVHLKVSIQPYGFIYHGPASQGTGEWEKVELGSAYAKLREWCARSNNLPGLIDGIVFAVGKIDGVTADVVIDDLLMTGPDGARKAVERARSIKRPNVRRVNFEFDDARGWRFSKDVKQPVVCEDGLCKFEVTGRDPIMYSPSVPFPGDTVGSIVVRMKSSGKQGQFFWTTEDSPKESEDKSVRFPVKDGELAIYRIEVGEHPWWKGKTITRLRLDPCMDIERAAVAVDYIKDSISVSGHELMVDNGAIQLQFEEVWPPVVTVRCGGRPLGTVECLVAQFEKKGIGYKGRGIASAPATDVRQIKPVKMEQMMCVVDVTAERTVSEEATRKFEATYRFTVGAGQSWFESRLLSIKNTDTVAYEIEGYYHLLQPADMLGSESICFPGFAGWIGGSGLFGAMTRAPADFTLGLRKIAEVARGEVTRKTGRQKIEPGMTWESNEPGVIIFGAKTATEEAFRKEIARIKPLLSSAPAAGGIRYEERKAK